MKVLVLSGENHRFNLSAPIIAEFLSSDSDLDVETTDDKDALKSLDGNDAVVFGTGFTRTERKDDGTVERFDDLTSDQEAGRFAFVEGGGGLVGIHGTAWWIPIRTVPLIGGHANWHPPGLTFNVEIDDESHPITDGVGTFEVDDEIYMSAWDPGIHVLASAEWAEKRHPLAWTQSFGKGRVFYTALGHGPDTFERPAMQKLMTQGTRWAAAA